MVISCAVDLTDQQDNFCLIMPVEINQRRATIDCVLVSIQILPLIRENLVAIFKPLNNHCSAVRQLAFLYGYCCTGYTICYIQYTLWLFSRAILLSGDIEKNPGPDTLKFCTWNLNSITAYDFLRVALLEAYNSVHKYDLIGIVETHLDTTINETRLALDGFTFYKSNHPQNMKRGGVGLYVLRHSTFKILP